MGETRKSVYQRICQLPTVFDHRDVELAFNWDHDQAKQFCVRAVEQGVAARAGERAGIYYNLFLEPKGRAVLLGDVLRRINPSVVMVGLSALHAASWITQNPRLLEVAMPRTRVVRSYPKIDGAVIVTRSLGWFSDVASSLSPADDQSNIFGLRSIGPEAAVADLLANVGNLPLMSGRMARDLQKVDPDALEPIEPICPITLQSWMRLLGVSDDVAAPYLARANATKNITTIGPEGEFVWGDDDNIGPGV
jgi:hypothetical protein